MPVPAAIVLARPPPRHWGRHGEPVENVSIRCVPSDPGAKTASTRSDASGEFSFTSLQSGTYEVAAIPDRDSDLQPTVAAVSDDQSHVELALAQSVFISGTVRWRDGSVFRPSLRLQPLDPVPDALANRDLRCDPEDDGTFRVAAAEGMRYAIEVYLRDWQGSVTLTGGEQVLAGTTGVVLTATRVTDAVDSDARTASNVAGTIVDMGGSPVVGADVIVVAPSGAEQRATTDADSRFAVTGVDPEAGDVVSVIVYAEGRGTTQLDDVKLGSQDVRMALPIERTIAGILLTADGEPAGRVRHPRAPHIEPRARLVARERRRRRPLRADQPLPRCVDPGRDRSARGRHAARCGTRRDEETGHRPAGVGHRPETLSRERHSPRATASATRDQNCRSNFSFGGGVWSSQ